MKVSNRTKVIVNPDLHKVDEIRNMLKANDGYCPCRLSRSEDTKCMCKEFREMVASDTVGECHCGLYINVDNSED